jgi:CRISPR-associated protein Csx14
MAGGPQVVTFALDDLLDRGETIARVIAVHLSPEVDPATGAAIERLAAEFTGAAYAGRPCALRFHPLQNGASTLDDIRSEADADAAWGAIYGLIAALKQQGRRLHVCISGGRRMLALLTMSAAMVHFDHTDRLWHMYTPAPFLERARDGAIMHARPRDGVRLIQVPVVPWGAYFPALRALARPTPGEVMAAQGKLLDPEQQRRCRQVLDRLTPRQIEVLRAFAAGGAPQDVAEALCITLKTVDSHKTHILAECRAAWGLDEEAWLDYHFLQDRFGPFFQYTSPPPPAHQRNL